MDCAIVGDIKNILTEEDNDVVQKKLKIILKEINIKYAEDIKIELFLICNNKFVGIFAKPSNIFYIVDIIIRKMHPVMLQFGIAIGESQVLQGIPEAPLLEGAEVYKNAIRMLERVKRKDKSKLSEKPVMLFYSGDPVDHLINGLVNLYCNIEKNWKKCQREIVYYCMEHNENQSEIAEHFGINQATVTRALKSSNFYKYTYALLQLEIYIEKTYCAAYKQSDNNEN